MDGRQDILRVFDLNQALGRQDEQTAAAVGRIVRNGDLGAVRQAVAGF